MLSVSGMRSATGSRSACAMSTRVCNRILLTTFFDVDDRGTSESCFLRQGFLGETADPGFGNALANSGIEVAVFLETSAPHCVHHFPYKAIMDDFTTTFIIMSNVNDMFVSMTCFKQTVGFDIKIEIGYNC